MLNDISLPVVTAARTSGDVANEQKSPLGEAQRPENSAAVASPIANPSFHLDAALGLVVIEFRNDSGAVTNTIPSQRQLAEYQRWQTTQFGPAPAWRSHGFPDDTAESGPETASAQDTSVKQIKPQANRD